MQQNNKINDIALRLIVVLAIGGGVCSLIKAGLDSVYFENTTEAVNTAAGAKEWAAIGILLIIIGLILASIARQNKKERSKLI